MCVYFVFSKLIDGMIICGRARRDSGAMGWLLALCRPRGQGTFSNTIDRQCMRAQKSHNIFTYVILSHACFKITGEYVCVFCTNLRASAGRLRLGLAMQI